MRFLKRAAGLAAAALVASATLARAAGPVPATVDQPVTITFYNYNLATAGIGADATRQLVSEFMAANPKVTVKAVGVSGFELISRVQADIATGKPPDVAQLVFSDLDFIVHSLGAKALEDMIPADELAAHFDGMVKPGLALGAMDGKTYGLAYTFSTPVLFYNADLFRKAGLDPDKPPRSWAEVRDAALKIRDETGKKGVYISAFGALTGDWIWQSLVLSNGGQVLSDDRKTLSFATPAAVGAAGMMRGLADGKVLENLTLEQSMEAMASGNLGMYLNSSALQTFLLNASQGKYELRAAPMPAFGDRPTAPTNSGSALFILTSDPLKQRAAFELMKFLTSKRGYTIITSKIGYLPLRPAIVDDPAYLGEWAKEHPMVRPNLEQLNRLKPWVSMPGQNYRQIQKMMLDSVEQAVFGDNADMTAVLAGAHARAQALMPR